MAIDELYQSGTDKILDDRVTRPLPEPIEQRSFGVNAWNITKAPVKGGAAGITESGGFMADILGAYGEMQAGYARSLDPSLMLDHDAAKKVQDEGAAARARVKSGEAFSTEIGTSFRQTAREYAPDPQSAGVAENLLFGLPRFMTKAVGYTVAAGGVPGAVMLAGDEGMTEADRLKAEGVDINTRTKVGAVAGVVAGASVLLPVAGSTWKTTAGLVTVGGPGGFVAQQAASKAILEHASYDKLADQYDPLDPVGLAVSTLVPAAFGAHATRAARGRPIPTESNPAAARQLQQMAGNEKLALPHDDPRLDAYAVTAAQREGISPELLLAVKNAGERSAPTAVSPKGAKGVMQFMDATWAEFGKGDPRDPVASIDAGARYLKHLVEHYNGNEQAALAHYNGGYKAGDAIMAGKPAPAKETRDYLARSEKYIAERKGEEAGKAAAQDPDMVAAARVQQVRETLEASNLHDPASAAGHEQHFDAAMRAADQIGAGEKVDVSAIAGLDHAGQTELLDRLAARLEAVHQEAAPDLQAAPHELATQTQGDLQVIAELGQAMDEVQARAPKPAPDQHAAVIFPDEGKAQAYLSEQKITKTHRIENSGRDQYSIVPKKKPGKDWRASVADREAKLAEQLRVANENAASRKAARDLVAEQKQDPELIIVHGSGNAEFDLSAVEIIRVNGQKQGKKGRSYGGLYGSSEADIGHAQGYAEMMGGTPTIYDVKIKKEAKVFNKDGDITRLSEAYINDLVEKGFGVVKGTDPRGRTEYAVINKSAIKSIEKRPGINDQKTKTPAAPLPGAAPKETPSPLAASIEAQAAEIARLSPDMMVQFEGMDAPMRLADAMEAVKAEAAKDAADAPLFETAAQCALQNL